MAVAIASIGARAARIIGRNRDARIAAVFASSFYITTKTGEFVCIGSPGIGNGPLNVLTVTAPPGGWEEAGLTVEQIATITDGHIHILGHPVLDCSKAVTWSPPPWPTPANLQLRRAALGRLQAEIQQRAPLEGFARIPRQSPHASPIARAARRMAASAMATLGDWLDANLVPGLDDAARHATHHLLGAGPGLTPSGDDIISGMLIALHAIRAHAAVAALARFIRAAPADATSPLSRALLEAAIDGEPCEAIHVVVSALLSGDVAALPPAIDAIGAIGHTSGWDMLAGVALALDALTPLAR